MIVGNPLGLITGYPGWLSSRLLESLRQPATTAWQEQLALYRWRVLAAPGVDPGPLPDNVETVQTGDIRDPATATGAMNGVDLVLHAAGILHPRRIPDLYAINRDGTAHLARAAVAAGVRRFAFVSTNAAAGFALDSQSPMRESDPPRPESHYGKSKREGEEALWQILTNTRTDGVVIRPTTFYGPHFAERHLRAYKMVRSGRPPLIGNGTNSVSMVYIDNLVQGLGLALSVPSAAGQTYFFADEKTYLWQDIFYAMGRAMNVEVRPRHLPKSIAALCNILDRGLGALGYYHL
ncbi:MAG: NAD-dependent epimerase/dehydratase family protein, partial [Candidatus Latescibacterota bacterium]|nr:NAD-dependent epimerase/dehydratase family protein [Candidatus Latescibacterota bacterium]